MWQKGQPHTLLVGLKTGIVTMKNMDDFQKIKNRTDA